MHLDSARSSSRELRIRVPTFSVVYFSRGTLPTKKGERRALLGDLIPFQATLPGLKGPAKRRFFFQQLGIGPALRALASQVRESKWLNGSSQLSTCWEPDGLTLNS